MRDTAGLHSAMFDCTSDTVTQGGTRQHSRVINLLGVKTNPIEVNETDKYAADGVNKLLVGNKCELSSKKVVSTSKTKELADSLNVKLLEASAKNAYNVLEALDMMSRGASRQSRKQCRLR